MNRGDIHWVELDKRRPAVVISPTARNVAASDVLVIPLSTTIRPAPWHVRLEKGEGGLSQASVAKCEQVTNVPKDLVSVRPLGRTLSNARIRELERALLIALGMGTPGSS